jgi:hypothetical protein
MKPSKKLHKFFSILMAGLMFLTSSGFTIDVHYCQNKLKRVSFIGKAKTCQEVAGCKMTSDTKSTKSCHSQITSCGETLSHKGCCENNSTFVKYNGDLPVVNGNVFQIAEFQLISDFLFSELFRLSNIDSQKPTFLNYWPPPIERDIPVLLHRYLC